MFACIIAVQSLMMVVCVVVIPQKLYFGFSTAACPGMADHYLLFKISAMNFMAEENEFGAGPPRIQHKKAASFIPPNSAYSKQKRKQRATHSRPFCWGFRY